MGLDEIKELQGLESCPHCGSNEGFWLALKPDRRSAQCKHCGAIIELQEVFQREDKKKQSRLAIFRKDKP